MPLELVVGSVTAVALLAVAAKLVRDRVASSRTRRAVRARLANAVSTDRRTPVATTFRLHGESELAWRMRSGAERREPGGAARAAPASIMRPPRRLTTAGAPYRPADVGTRTRQRPWWAYRRARAFAVVVLAPVVVAVAIGAMSVPRGKVLDAVAGPVTGAVEPTDEGPTPASPGAGGTPADTTGTVSGVVGGSDPGTTGGGAATPVDPAATPGPRAAGTAPAAPPGTVPPTARPIRPATGSTTTDPIPTPGPRRTASPAPTRTPSPGAAPTGTPQPAVPAPTAAPGGGGSPATATPSPTLTSQPTSVPTAPPTPPPTSVPTAPPTPTPTPTPPPGAPIADFDAEADGLTVRFRNRSRGAASSSWSFGDGDTSTARNPTHAYAAPGSYTVVLTVTNDAGTTSSRTAVVVVGG